MAEFAGDFATTDLAPIPGAEDVADQLEQDIGEARLEQMLQVLEAPANHLTTLTHADADLLLRSWLDPRVCAVIPRYRGNKVPPSGGLCFITLQQAQVENAAAVQEAPEDWRPFDASGSASLHWQRRRDVEGAERA